MGVAGNEAGGAAERAALLRRKIDAQLDGGVARILLWAWGNDPSGFDIGPGDPVLDQLADAATRLRDAD